MALSEPGTKICRALALLALGVLLIACQTPAPHPLTAADHALVGAVPDPNCLAPQPDGTSESVRQGRLAQALLRAAFHGDSPCVEQMIRAGADVDTRLPDGTSALGLAARQGQIEAIQALLAAGAQIDLANRAGVTPLSAAAGSNQAAAMSRLLQAGADVHQVTVRGWSALHHAIAGCHLAPARLLLATGADVDQADGHGNTALLLAAAVCPGAIALLLDQGANIERGEIQGMTALLVAAQNGQADAVELLLARGADPGHRDLRGRDYRQWAELAANTPSMAR